MTGLGNKVCGVGWRGVGGSEREEFVRNDAQVSGLSNWMAGGAILQERDSQRSSRCGENNLSHLALVGLWCP